MAIQEWISRGFSLIEPREVTNSFAVLTPRFRLSLNPCLRESHFPNFSRTPVHPFRSGFANENLRELCECKDFGPDVPC